MNRRDALYEKVSAWFRTTYGLRRVPISREQIDFAEPEKVGGKYRIASWQRRTDAKKSLLISIACGALLAAAIYWNTDGGNFFFYLYLTGASTLFIFYMPVRIITARQHIEIAPDEQADRHLAHEVAHACHFSPRIRGIVRFPLTLLFMLLFSSYIEGVALCIEHRYCRDHGYDFDDTVVPRTAYRAYRILRWLERRFDTDIAAICMKWL